MASCEAAEKQPAADMQFWKLFRSVEPWGVSWDMHCCAQAWSAWPWASVGHEGTHSL